MQRVSWVRAIVAALTVPMVAAVIALALLWAWAADLPDPLAVHFGPGGDADGFASLDAIRWSVLLGPATAAVLVTVLVLIAGRDLRTARAGATLAAGLGSLLAALPILLVAPQRGLSDVATATVPGWAIVAAVVIGGVAAVGAYLTMPVPRPVRATARPGADAPRMPLGSGERVAWSGSAAMPLGVAAVVLGVPVAVSVGLMAAGRASVTTVLVVVAVAVAATVLLLVPTRVVVDNRGLTARGLFPVRPVHIPLDEVAEARPVTIKVLNGFGGYGYRVGPSGTGLIARPGPALQVTRGDGSRFTVTVDRAEEAAAVLNALATRDRV